MSEPVGELWFVTGGARSGKSGFARERAADTHRPVVYIATMEPGDDETHRRVERHRAERPAEWTTIEAPLDIVGVLEAAAADACALIDCLSLWVSNRLLRLGEEPSVAGVESLERELSGEVATLLAAARARAASTIVVSNEVGAGVVPPYPLGRAYRDLLGTVNQRVAAASSRAWLLVAGRALELPQPAPPGKALRLS